MISFIKSIIRKIPDKYLHLGKNVCFVLMGNIGTRLLGFIMLPFYTRILTSSDYGTMDLISTYATMLLGVVTLQIQDSVFVFSSGKDFRSKSVYFSGGLFFCLVSFLIWAGIFKGIMLLCPRDSFWYKNAWYIFSYLIGLSFVNYIQSFCRSIDKMFICALSGIVSGLAIVTLAVTYLLKYPSGNTMILIQIAGSLTGGTFVAISIKAWKYITCRFDYIKVCKEMIKYGLPIVPAPIMCWVLSSFNRPLLEKYCSLDAVGFFAVAMKFPSIIVMVWGIVGSAWQISVMEEYFKNSFEDFYNKMFYLLVDGLCVLAFIFSVFAPFYMKYIVDPSYYECNNFIPILSVGSSFYVLGAMIGTIYLPPKKSKYFLYSSVITFIVAFVANITMVPTWGMYGACFSYSAGMLVEFLVRMRFSQKLVKIRIHITDSVIVIATILALIVFYCAQGTVLQKACHGILGITILFLVYKKIRSSFHLTWSFRPIKRDMKH